MRLGADVSSLDGLAERCARAARQLHALVRDLDHEVGRLDWRGPDAQRFGEEWSKRSRPGALRTGRELGAVAADLRTQSDRQRETSRDGVGVGVGATASLPKRIELYTAEMHGGQEIMGGASFQLRVEHLRRGRLRVTETGQLVAGVGVSPGSGMAVDVGSRTSASGALGSAEAAALVGAGASWNIAERDLDRLIVARARAHAGDLAGDLGLDTAVSLAGSMPGVGMVAGALGLGNEWSALTWQAPAPVSRSIELGTRIDGGGVAGGGPFGATVSGSAALEGALGVTQDRASGDVTLFIRSDAHMNAQIAQQLSPGVGVGMGVDQRVGVRFDAAGSLRAIDLDQWETVDDTRSHTAMTIDLRATSDRSASHVLIRQLEHGVASGNSEAIRSAIVGLIAAEANAAQVQRAEYRVSVSDEFAIEIPIGGISVTRETLVAKR